MTTPKTARTGASVDAYIDQIDPPEMREDAFRLLELMKRATGRKPEMWGPSIIGFGAYDFQYRSGRSGTWMATGFAVRKSGLTIYIMPGFKLYADALQRLGRHKTSKTCLYVRKLDDVDEDVLAAMVSDSLKRMEEKSAED